MSERHIRIYMDGNAWCAVRDDFINLQESAAGFGSTPDEAVLDLINGPQGCRIGPIPAVDTLGEVRWSGEPGAIAATRPIWGGYLPTCAPGDAVWRADTTDTRLWLRDGRWFVERPARLCCRAVVIATEALIENAEPPPGILPEEVAKAREILASDDPRAWAWAASGGWELSAWPVPATEPTEAEEVVSQRGTFDVAAD